MQLETAKVAGRQYDKYTDFDFYPFPNEHYWLPV
jgi:hypothetical protein